jgi:hypothetical protein
MNVQSSTCNDGYFSLTVLKARWGMPPPPRTQGHL